MNKKDLSERDICSKFITPALVSANWDLMSQIREEVSLTKGRVIVRGQVSTRGDQLETHLATARTASAHLLDSKVHQLLTQRMRTSNHPSPK